jgi:predicted O-linked N-acetylglucosamine transferase (SPINDLY family)
MMKRVGRNDPCPCGSGKKYKQCCPQRVGARAASGPAGATAAVLQIPSALQAALEHHQAGRLPEAEAIYRQILQAQPNHPDALHLLGMIAYQTGRNGIAVELIGKAIGANPSDPVYYSNLGNALQAQGSLDEAVTSYRAALALQPDYANAHNNLGTALRAQGKMDAAVESYYKALAFQPDLAEAHFSLGHAFQVQGKLDAAFESYRGALALRPDYAEGHNNLGTVIQAQGKLDAAVESFRTALALKPDYVDAHNNLGTTLRALGKFDAAIESFHKALALKPNYAEAHNNLGNALQAQGNLDAAVESFHKALALRPDFVEALSNLGNALGDLGNFDAAVERYRDALALKPDLVETHCSLGNALRTQGKLDAAVESYRRALALRPDYADAYGNLLFLYGYHALLDPEAYLSLACGWEQACVPVQDRQAARSRTFQRSPLAGRRLRVGYVSGDYRQHAVSYYVEQLFAYHDRQRIEVYAYTTHSEQDAITARLQALVDHWVPAIGVSDATVRDRIEADGIDVLIDLSGHTAHNRLGVFARRAAPVQAHYLGFMGSTGLTEMDYWIGDAILTPPQTDSHFREQVWRLPRVWVSYDGKADAPAPTWAPAADGTIWVGSFNGLGKLTPATLALWAKVLHALPQGRLLLKTKDLADAGNRRRILDDMAAHGIAPHRIELQDRSVTPDWPAHMAYYNRLDIALDPVGGVGGGTTTCDALWMAVPVVTLIGDRMASSMTASMLGAMGHREWIAQSEADYVDKVAALAGDVQHRKALRLIQRTQMAQSPLCDGPGLARSLENAYLEMYGRWLALRDPSHHAIAR